MLAVLILAGCCLAVINACNVAGNSHYYNEDNKHAYAVNPTAKSWEQALEDAASCNYFGVHGHLLTVTSQAENNFVKNFIGLTWAWTAGHEITGVNQWYVWASGPEIGVSITNIGWAPSSVTVPWACLALNKDGYLDQACNNNLAYIVEFECPSGQWLKKDVGCVADTSLCRRIDDHNQWCNECYYPYSLVWQSTGGHYCSQVPPTCPSGQYKLSDPEPAQLIGCVPCDDSNCDKCHDEKKGRCHKCNEGYKLSSSGACDSCEVGYVADGAGPTWSCEKCDDANCLECRAPGFGECKKCERDGTLLKDGTCGCVQYPCNKDHGKCVDVDTCECEDGWAGHRCHAKCPIGFHGPNCETPYICHKCFDSRFCIADNTCTKCKPGYWAPATGGSCEPIE